MQNPEKETSGKGMQNPEKKDPEKEGGIGEREENCIWIKGLSFVINYNENWFIINKDLTYNLFKFRLSKNDEMQTMHLNLRFSFLELM